MKIAVWADLHLTDRTETVKMQVFEWALSETLRQKADAIVCIGDLTASGNAFQCRAVLEKLSNSAIPYCSTPGNAELRSSFGREAEKLFTVEAPENIPVILLNTARREPLAEDLQKLENLPDNSAFLLATHVPVERWSQAAQSVLEQARKRRAITALIAGHNHNDDIEVMRGMDPDKASGGVPMIAFFEQNKSDGSWQRSDCAIPGVDPGCWEDSLRKKLAGHIGLSAMHEPLEGVKFAVQEKVPHLEFRPPLECSDELMEYIKVWRAGGGKTLSLHLPNLLPDDPEGVLKKYALIACKIGCDRVTLHVPKITADKFAENEQRFLERFKEDLSVLLENNIVIGIENLHTSPGKESFEERNYGCNIEECVHWVTLLRQHFNTDKIGFHLDVGHARNNAPFSMDDNLSDYYLVMNHLINGFHLHQVEHIDGKYINHCQVRGFYDKLISFAGLFMAFKNGMFNEDVPMFMEVRTLPGNIETYSRIKSLLQ